MGSTEVALAKCAVADDALGDICTRREGAGLLLRRATTQPEHQMERRLFLDVVVGKLDEVY